MFEPLYFNSGRVTSFLKIGRSAHSLRDALLILIPAKSSVMGGMIGMGVKHKKTLMVLSNYALQP